VLIRFTASDVSFDIFKRVHTVIMALLQLRTFKTYGVDIGNYIPNECLQYELIKLTLFNI